ncbi:MAG: formylglycine-generating enzyme family protein [Verrucomicrobiales bacterium]
MLLVPAGEFLMGSAEGNADEGPPHRVNVSAFYIDKYEVTNEAFAEFVRKSGKYEEIEGSWFRYYAPGCRELIAHYGKRESTRRSAAEAALKMMPKGDHAKFPVRGVTWRDAAAYAKWAGKRLPTEAEWEKAARGTKGWLYPWGSQWNAKLCRAGLEPEAGPVAVGSFPGGVSVYGAYDMAGNVWEWVADWYGEDYYATSKNAVDPEGPKGLPNGQLPGSSEKAGVPYSAKQQGRESDTRKVIRGGGWAGMPKGQAQFNSRCARRLWSNPSYWHQDTGFRCAKGVK